MSRRGRRPKSLPAGRAIGWWIAGFEERLYPERETVAERVRWGTESRVSSGEGPDVVVRFPDAATPPGAGDDAQPPVDEIPPQGAGAAAQGAMRDDDASSPPPGVGGLEAAPPPVTDAGGS